MRSAVARRLRRVRGFNFGSRAARSVAWLVEQLAARAADCGAEGYVFAAPAQRDPERVRDQSNSAGAVRAALDACGLTWAVPHTFRRTVATLLDQANRALRPESGRAICMTWSRSLRVMARVWSRTFDLAAVEVTVRTWRVASLDSTPLSTA
jgi:integrase